LYTEFAAPLQLYSSVLLILKTSDHRDDTLLEKVWMALLDEGAFDADRADITAALRQNVLPQTAVGGTLTELARRFYPSEAACPLGESPFAKPR